MTTISCVALILCVYFGINIILLFYFWNDKELKDVPKQQFFIWFFLFGTPIVLSSLISAFIEAIPGFLIRRRIIKTQLVFAKYFIKNKLLVGTPRERNIIMGANLMSGDVLQYLDKHKSKSEFLKATPEMLIFFQGLTDQSFMDPLLNTLDNFENTLDYEFYIKRIKKGEYISDFYKPGSDAFTYEALRAFYGESGYLIWFLKVYRRIYPIEININS